MRKKVYFAVAHRAVEEFIEKEMANEIEVIGSAVYRESVLQAIKKEEPDILIIRETLPGKTDFLEIIDTIRVQCRKHVQIIVMTGGRQPGDELLSALVRYSVFDLIVGDNINIKEVCKLIRTPNLYKDVSMYAPKVKIDERTKKQIFEAPTVPTVIEKEIIREVIVDNTDIVDLETSARAVEELEMIKKEKIEIENEQIKIKEEKEKIDKEKETLAQEKKRLEDEYKKRQLDFEQTMELKLNGIYQEKDRLIEIEKKRIQNELEFAMSEVERIKSESEIIIDEEKRKLNQSKQAEMEKNIEIIRLENEQKIKRLEQEAVKKIQLEQQKFNQMKIDEIEKFKQENAQLEEKYKMRIEQELSEKKQMESEIAKLKEKQDLLEKQREADLKALEDAKSRLEHEKMTKYTAQDEAREELRNLEVSLKEKEEELNQEKELLEIKYTSLENSLFAEFETRKRTIEDEAKKKLEVSRNHLKLEMQKLLDIEKNKLLSGDNIDRAELEKSFTEKQSQISERYKTRLQELINAIKVETARRMSELEQEFMLKKKSEEDKLFVEKSNLDKERDSLNKEMASFYEDKKALMESINNERKKLELEHEEFEKNMKNRMLEKERVLDSERNLLKDKEEELNRKIKEFNEEQKKAASIKDECMSEASIEKERLLEEEKQKLLRQQEVFEQQRLDLEAKSKREDEYLKSQLRKLEKEKELIKKMKSEAASMNMQNSNISGKNILTFLGCKSGVGTTTVALNTAISLANKNYKVLYLELNKEFSSIAYTYKLGFQDNGIDVAMKQLGENNYDEILDNIILLKDVERSVSTEDIMYDNYKKMPKTLDYLFYSGGYYAGEREYEESSFKDLMMFLLVKLDYDYIIFDMNMTTKLDSNNTLVLDNILSEVLKFSSKIYYIVTQDLSSVGACISSRKVMKKCNIPVNDFKFIVNKYEPKANLSKEILSEWLKVEVDLVLPNKHKEVLDSSYEGLPLVIHSKDREIDKFYKLMVSDIEGRKNKKKKK